MGHRACRKSPFLAIFVRKPKNFSPEKIFSRFFEFLNSKIARSTSSDRFEQKIGKISNFLYFCSNRSLLGGRAKISDFCPKVRAHPVLFSPKSQKSPFLAILGQNWKTAKNLAAISPKRVMPRLFVEKDARLFKALKSARFWTKKATLSGHTGCQACPKRAHFGPYQP